MRLIASMDDNSKGRVMEKLQFSKERLLEGISRVADYVGLTTLYRIFEGEEISDTVNINVSIVNDEKPYKTTDEIFNEIRKK